MKIQKFISSKIKTKLVNLVFETHIQFGLLNEFIIDSSLTNDELLPRTENEKKKIIKEKLISKYKDKKYIDGSFWTFATGRKGRIPVNNNNYSEKDILDIDYNKGKENLNI
jgi:hypothetical protein